ncbi:MAG: hypothetical protein MHMPM18_005053, partial [Marteilia pararefringens]
SSEIDNYTYWTPYTNNNCNYSLKPLYPDGFGRNRIRRRSSEKSGSDCCIEYNFVSVSGDKLNHLFTMNQREKKMKRAEFGR